MSSNRAQALVLFAFSIAALVVSTILDQDPVSAGIAGGAFVAGYSRIIKALFDKEQRQD